MCSHRTRRRHAASHGIRVAKSEAGSVRARPEQSRVRGVVVSTLPIESRYVIFSVGEVGVLELGSEDLEREAGFCGAAGWRDEVGGMVRWVGRE